MSVRLRRLYAEYERLKVLFADHDRIRIVETAGDPPDRYVVEYRVKGLTETKEGVQESDLHRVQITLGQNYPNEMASCMVVGKPVFHPNIDHLAVCTADVSSASRTVDQTIVFIGELITFQAYNLKSPRNGDAKKWTEANLHRLPLERVNLLPRKLLEGTPLAVPGAAEFQERPMANAAEPKCTNCGYKEQGARLRECWNHHLTCPDCALVCANCAHPLCLVCELQTCSECLQPVCADCAVSCSHCSRSVCVAHAGQCPVCATFRCSACLNPCGNCGRRFCATHLDQGGCCPECRPAAVQSDARHAEPPVKPIYQQVVEAPEFAPAPQIQSRPAQEPEAISTPHLVLVPPIQSPPARAAAEQAAVAPALDMQAASLPSATPSLHKLIANGTLVDSRYRILTILGRGGMSIVYLAEDTHLKRNVALKIIRFGQTADKHEVQFLRQALLQEAQLAGRLSHPGIVTIYDSFELGELVCVTMEFVQGVTLQQAMERNLLTDRQRMLQVLMEAAKALDYAHREGVVHRDIKLSNIMVRTSGAEDGRRVKVTDFGIARESPRVTGSTAPARRTMVIGTAGYMSPEQLNGIPADSRCDQFALAIVAHKLLTGRLLFEAEDTNAWIAQVLTAEPDLDPGLGKEACTVFRRSLSKERSARYARCEEFISELERALRPPVQAPARPVLVPSNAAPPSVRSPTPLKPASAQPPARPQQKASPPPLAQQSRNTPAIASMNESQDHSRPRFVITAEEAFSVPQTALQPPAKQRWVSPQQEVRYSGKAIVSLILGLLGLPLLGILVGWFAIGIGVSSLRQIDRQEGLQGKKLALWGIILGAVDIIFWIILIVAYGHSLFGSGGYAVPGSAN